MFRVDFLLQMLRCGWFHLGVEPVVENRTSRFIAILYFSTFYMNQSAQLY